MVLRTLYRNKNRIYIHSTFWQESESRETYQNSPQTLHRNMSFPADAPLDYTHTYRTDQSAVFLFGKSRHLTAVSRASLSFSAGAVSMFASIHQQRVLGLDLSCSTRVNVPCFRLTALSKHFASLVSGSKNTVFSSLLGWYPSRLRFASLGQGLDRI